MFLLYPRVSATRLAGLVAMAAGVSCPLMAEIPDTLRHSLYAPKTEPQAGEQQGYSVAASGTRVAVGSPQHDFNTSLPDTGAVKVYDAANGNLLQLLVNPSPAAYDYFGSSVAISGTRVAVSTGSDEGGNRYSGSVYVFDLASASPTVPIARLDNPSPGAYDQFGHSVAIDGDRVAVGAWLDDTDAANSGRVYVYDLSLPDPESPVATLTNPSPAEDDCFGTAVALSGGRLLVTAYQEDTATINAGGAYVYDLDSATPGLPVTSLANPDPDANDCFGTSLALSGALVVIGAESDEVGGMGNAGSVYVFDLDSGTPSEPALSISNPGPEIQDCFGTSVAISAEAIVVGSYQDNQEAEDAGIAYVYDLSGALITTLNGPAPEETELFGNSVAAVGSTVVVGARLDDSGSNEGGSASVFDISSQTPSTPVTILASPQSDSPDQFGNAVSVSEDFVVIGAAFSDATATDAGRVSVYDLSSLKPTTSVVTIENPGPAAGDGFGISVAISGQWLLVGAAGDDTGAVDSGSAYLYDLISATPGVPVRTFNNPGPAANDGFGGSVAISGNYAVIGAAGDDTGASNAGRAYLYHLNGSSPTIPVATLAKTSPAVNDAFGRVVAISGNRVIAGIPGDDAGAGNAGAVRVFDLAGSLLFTLPNPGPGIDDGFGISAAISGTRVVVGADGDDTGFPNSGSAYVFDLASGTPTTPVVTLQNPTPAAADQFGYSSAISGALVMIGAPFDDTGPVNSGRAYLYDVSGSSPSTPVGTLAKSGFNTEDRFGSSVAIDGLTVVVGTPLDNKTAPDKGAAYVFGPSAPEIAVEGPPGTELADGASTHDFGAVEASTSGDAMSFVISNTGITALTITSVSVTGGNAEDFTVNTSGLAGSIAANGNDSFTVTFSPPVAGVRTTTLRIVSNDTDESPFEINLRGDSLSAANDTDGDGLNDLSELKMVGLGFDWQIAQNALVDSFLETSGLAGFYPKSQVRALVVPSPSLAKDFSGGIFKLTIGLEMSENLTSYEPLPLTAGDSEINPEGELEFRFNAPDAALFRLESK